MPSIQEKQRRLRVGEAAKYVGLPASTLNKMRRTGGGPPFIKIGVNIVLYDTDDLDAWLEANKRKTTTS